MDCPCCGLDSDLHGHQPCCPWCADDCALCRRHVDRIWDGTLFSVQTTCGFQEPKRLFLRDRTWLVPAAVRRRAVLVDRSDYFVVSSRQPIYAAVRLCRLLDPAGLLDFIKSPQVHYGLLALLIGLAAGSQFLWSTDYLRDWQAQKNLFWQMTWRAPGLKPNTLVLMNEELSFYADNSISAPLNWIYAPQNRSDQIDYVLFYPTNRLDHSLPALKKDIPIQYDYIAGQFTGNTSQVVAFYYDPPACLRLLEPDIDPNNRFLLEDSHMREASVLSNRDQILDSATAVMPAIYYPEPAHGWCYYFEKADLARQFGDWKEVAKLGDTALTLEDHPNNPVERFVFIEGYAHAGDWDRALKLSKESYKVSKEYVGPLLCQLWARIETETTDSPEKTGALSEVKTIFSCKP